MVALLNGVSRVPKLLPEAGERHQQRSQACRFYFSLDRTSLKESQNQTCPLERGHAWNHFAEGGSGLICYLKPVM